MLYEKLNNDNSQLIHERDELMDELGLHSSTNYLELAEKYKKDVKDYENYIEKLRQELEEKIVILKKKEEDFSKLQTSLRNTNVEENQLMEMIKKNK